MIKYTIIRSKIKNIYIQIKDGEVIVKANKKVKKDYIEEIIKQKSNWILKKLEQEKKYDEKYATPINKEEVEYLKQTITEAVEKYSKRINEFPEKVRIRNIKYAWGSCSARRNITINIKLARKRKKVIEYVVLHELCHLKYMNHSRNFWELVEKNMKDYTIYRKELKN